MHLVIDFRSSIVKPSVQLQFSKRRKRWNYVFSWL